MRPTVAVTEGPEKSIEKLQVDVMVEYNLAVANAKLPRAFLIDLTDRAIRATASGSTITTRVTRGTASVSTITARATSETMKRITTDSTMT